jgi:F420H(2)-dependent quinone reductase
MSQRIVERLQKSVVNRLDRLAFALRTPPPGDALLETTGRRSGQPRVTPVCDCLEDNTFWWSPSAGATATT